MDVREAPLRVTLLHARRVLYEPLNDLVLPRRSGPVLLVGVVEDELNRVEAVRLADVHCEAKAWVGLEVRACDDRRRDLVLEVADAERLRRGAVAGARRGALLPVVRCYCRRAKWRRPTSARGRGNDARA